MTPFLLATVLLGQGASAPAPNDPAASAKALVSRMFARYYAATSARGSFVLTQVATGESGSATVTIATEFALEKPARLFVAQTDSRRAGRRYVVTSDGTTFTYDAPGLETPPGHRRAEVVGRPEGALEVPDLYAAARQSLPDVFSPFLGLAVSMRSGRTNSQGRPVAKNWGMAGFNAQLATLREVEPATVAGKTCRVVAGDWRAGEGEAVSGRYRLFVTPEGDLVRFRTEQRLAVAGEPETKTRTGVQKPATVSVTIVSDWTGAVELDGAISPKTFAVVR